MLNMAQEQRMKRQTAIIAAGLLLPLIAAKAAGPGAHETPTPHQLNHEASRSETEAARVATLAQAKQLADASSVQVRDIQAQKLGSDTYLLRDSSGQIRATIPIAVLEAAAVAPSDTITVEGTLDKKQTPWQLRVYRVEKR
jgi:uncharacterized protein (TIGR00156 family)